jgi:hypothetical protein
MILKATINVDKLSASTHSINYISNNRGLNPKSVKEGNYAGMRNSVQQFS